jgi:RNA polymerase sigma factor (sigma-70 family)
MISNTMTVGEGIPDTELVALSLAGDRDAFGQIVSRYQALICSLAYSATGSLGQSQDLAQETFITAWNHLRLLRERHKLRAWLCGIARCLIGKTLRREGREPTHGAETLDGAESWAAHEPLPSERLMSQEEEALLWRSLARIPELYREPLILFYREHQSISAVASALDLGEDAVKQRLSRGRKLLQDEVLTFIEGALQRSSPSKVFTVGVVAALPVFASSASAATVGVTAAKGAATSKGAALLAFLTPVAGLLTGCAATLLSYKMSLERAGSDLERDFIKRLHLIFIAFVLMPVALVLGALSARPWAISHPSMYTGLIFACMSAWIPATAGLVFWIKRRSSQLTGLVSRSDQTPVPSSTRKYEYRTSTCLLGLPLLHVRFGSTWVNTNRPVKAWIAAADDAAIGVIFAFGGLAIAPIAVGGFALGGIVFGGFAGGLLCYAGFGFGAWVIGGLASGLMAVGGCVSGWIAALGGIAVSHQFAVGGVALGPHANDATANAFIQGTPFFHYAFLLVTKWLWPVLLASLVPSMWIWHVTRPGRTLPTAEVRVGRR